MEYDYTMVHLDATVVKRGYGRASGQEKFMNQGLPVPRQNPHSGCFLALHFALAGRACEFLSHNAGSETNSTVAVAVLRYIGEQLSYIITATQPDGVCRGVRMILSGFWKKVSLGY